MQVVVAPTSRQHVFGAHICKLQQILPVGHVQLSVPPQPSEGVPHWLALQVFGVQQVALEQTWPASAEHVQLSVPPQPSEAVPHWPALQVFGVQQVRLEQTWPIMQVQLIVLPQPSETVVPHWPLQGLMVGVQQLANPTPPSGSAGQTWPAGHGQLTVLPHPSEAVPHWPALQVFGVQQVALEQTWPAEQPQGTIWPQPSWAIVPHLPLQGFALGVQQFVLLQTWPAEQLFTGHAIIPPQPSGILALHRPLQVPGAQHVLFGMQRWPAGHNCVPETPQLTFWLQLFVAELQLFAPHACCVLSAVQPPHVLFVHTRPPAHTPQLIGLPQLSAVIPQRPVHQFANVLQKHWPLFGSQPQPVRQLFGHFHWTPHESVPVLQRF
jgi:hypothetical protein